MRYETLLVEVTDRVAFVTINRPDVRNAVSREVQDDLRHLLAVARDDDGIGLWCSPARGRRRSSPAPTSPSSPTTRCTPD